MPICKTEHQAFDIVYPFFLCSGSSLDDESFEKRLSPFSSEITTRVQPRLLMTMALGGPCVLSSVPSEHP